MLLGALIASVGVAMALRARRGLRRGDRPHCRRCDYSLVGIASDHCPECGTPLTTQNIVRGQRVRRPGLMAGGGAVALVGVAVLVAGGTAAADRVDWYRLKPAAWLIADLESGPPSLAARAWTVLRRRDDVGALSDRQRSRLAEAVLAAQATAPAGSPLREMVDWLGEAAAADELTPQQKERFFRQIVRLRLEVREKVIAGDPMPYRIHHDGRGPASLGWWTRVEHKEVAIDGQKVKGAGGGATGFMGMGGGGSSGSSLPPVKPPGPKTVAATMRVQVYRGPGQFDENNPQTELLHEQEVVLADTTEVVDAAPADLVRAVRQPDAAAVRASLKARDFRRDFDRDRLSGMLDVTNAPADLAFDVFVRADGKEYPLGGVSWKKGANGGWGLNGPYPADASTIDLVLRGSSERARLSIGLYEFWDGEIVLPNVPVRDERRRNEK